MGFDEYRASQRLEIQALAMDGNAFYSLVLAAMRQADTDNLQALRAAFPGLYEELTARYHAPGGELPDD